MENWHRKDIVTTLEMWNFSKHLGWETNRGHAESYLLYLLYIYLLHALWVSREACQSSKHIPKFSYRSDTYRPGSVDALWPSCSSEMYSKGFYKTADSREVKIWGDRCEEWHTSQLQRSIIYVVGSITPRLTGRPLYSKCFNKAKWGRILLFWTADLWEPVWCKNICKCLLFCMNQSNDPP